jgi:FkbM family methyltransferase
MPQGEAPQDIAPGCRQQSIAIADGISVEVVIGIEADDPVSLGIAHATHSNHALFDLMLKLVRPGQVVLDLGAHVGLFSLAAAAVGCQVAAVEASPRNAQLLRESVRRNRFDAVRVVQAAVSDRAGTVEFNACGPYGHLIAPDMKISGTQVRSATVEQLLAELGWSRVDFIKMDIEGSELSALEGMSRLLAGPDAPPILYESNSHTLSFYGHTPRQLKQALRDLGYRSYLIAPGRLVPSDVDDRQVEVVADLLAIKQRPPAIDGWQFEPWPTAWGPRLKRLRSAARRLLRRAA